MAFQHYFKHLALYIQIFFMIQNNSQDRINYVAHMILILRF